MTHTHSYIIQIFWELLPIKSYVILFVFCRQSFSFIRAFGFLRYLWHMYIENVIQNLQLLLSDVLSVRIPFSNLIQLFLRTLLKIFITHNNADMSLDYLIFPAFLFNFESSKDYFIDGIEVFLSIDILFFSYLAAV